jgi:hypothetical protein
VLVRLGQEVQEVPRGVEPLPPALLHEFLDWIADRPRSYDDAIGAWRSNCPRHPVLDDAFTDGLVAVEGRSVVLTESGRQYHAARHG